MRVRLGLVLALGLALGGCKLIEQRTFNPEAGKAPVIPPAPVAAPKPPAGPPALIVVTAGAQPETYLGPLREAVAAAVRRKPGVVFDVVETLPPDSDPGAPLGREAAAIGRAIVDQGVPPVRVRLVARPDAAAVAREVRVYVR